MGVFFKKNKIFNFLTARGARRQKISSIAFAMICAGLTACNGTNIGGTVEKAIAPLALNPNSPSNLDQTIPQDFASDIPIYPQAILQNIERAPSSATSQTITARWHSQDSTAQVVKFYEDATTKKEWQLLMRSPDRNFVIQKADLLVTVSVQPIVNNKLNNKSTDQNYQTSIFVQYLRDRTVKDLNLNSAIATTTEPKPTTTPDLANPTPQPSPVTEFTDFTDITSAPMALRGLITDLNKLGVISPKQANLFKPDALIMRREYVRWLIKTNNRFYQNLPSRQIRESSSETPKFVDVPRKDLDFASIQSFVNIGLIQTNPANSLGNTSRFRPDDPLTREELLQWKVPLDLRSALPAATKDIVKQAWGFQDSDRLSPQSLKFMLADFQAGDLSNIRRSFGYTTLFQPQKYVTRAEAAAALWYFGTPNDGLSARNILEQVLEKPPQQ